MLFNKLNEHLQWIFDSNRLIIDFDVYVGWEINVSVFELCDDTVFDVLFDPVFEGLCILWF